ncbi:hypothetical protein BBP40_000450 [Aspergillus hancockii]|nr:hypothetical protein BBP40_000450 [Aspergillus hancockii]
MEPTDYKDSNSSASTMIEKEEPGKKQPDLEQGPEVQTTGSPQPGGRVFPETDLDRGIVGWDGQDDPANPQNFAPNKNWLTLGLISAFTFISPLASSMFSPAVSYMAAEFKETNETILSFTVSIYLLGYVFGPMILAPLSKIYGRCIVLSAANWFFVVWQIGCALAPNIATLIVFRLFAGIGGSACLTLGAGVIADLFPPEQRGMATSIWGVGPLIGPVAGPTDGGFLGEELGIEVLNKETYAPVLIRWKTARLSKELGRTNLRSAYELQRGQTSTAQVLRESREARVAAHQITDRLSLIDLYVPRLWPPLSVFHDDFKRLHKPVWILHRPVRTRISWDRCWLCDRSCDRGWHKRSRDGETGSPKWRENRTGDAASHDFLLVRLVGRQTCPLGRADHRYDAIWSWDDGVYLPIQTYVIDCYPAYAASANATLTATRSLVGALLPLVGPSMFESLGLGWGNSLLGFLALAFVPIPIIFTRWGKLIREKYPVNLDKGDS